MTSQLPPIGSLWRRIAMGFASITLFPKPTKIPDSLLRTIRGDGPSIDAENIRRDWQANAVRIDKEDQ